MTRFVGEPATGSSLAIRVIDASRHRRMPWKNGFGTTIEIAIDPPDADLGGRFRWRLSVADVHRSGPFSAFPGYERTIMVIEGNGMDLAIGNDAPRRLDRLFEPFVFSGDARAECRLIEGPIRDFNIMVDRSVLRSHTAVWRLGAAAQSIALSSPNHVIHCFDGAIDLVCDEIASPCRLGAGDTVVVHRTKPETDGLRVVAVAGKPMIAVIALEPR
jgi:hypothetical protein